MFYQVPKANDEDTCSIRTLAWIDAILTGTPTSAAVKAACDKDDIDTDGMGSIPYEAFPGIKRCGGGSRGNKPVFSEVEHWFKKCGDGAYYLSTVKNDEDIKHAVGLHKGKTITFFSTRTLEAGTL